MDSNHFYTKSDYQPKVSNEKENGVEPCQVILGVTATTRTLLPLDNYNIPHLLSNVKGFWEKIKKYFFRIFLLTNCRSHGIIEIPAAACVDGRPNFQNIMYFFELSEK